MRCILYRALQERVSGSQHQVFLIDYFVGDDHCHVDQTPTEDITTSSTVLPLPNSTTTSSVELDTEELENYMGAYVLSTYQIGISPTGPCREPLSITLEEDTLSIYKKSDLAKEPPTLLSSLFKNHRPKICTGCGRGNF